MQNGQRQVSVCGVAVLLLLCLLERAEVRREPYGSE